MECARRVERVQRHLVNALRFVRIGCERRAGIDYTDEGCDYDGKRERRYVFEPIDDAHAGLRHAEFFFEFAQGGAPGIAVGRIDDAAGESDFPRIPPQMRGAPDEHERGFIASHDRNDDGGLEHRARSSGGMRRAPAYGWRVLWRGFVFDVVAVALALVVRFAQPPAGWIEAHYSNGVYPAIDRGVRAVTGPLPFCLGDVLSILAVVWLSRYVFVTLRRARRHRVRAVLRMALRLVAVACILFVWFVVSWGYGYSRIPLSDKIIVHDERTNEDTVSVFADRVVDELSHYARAAHRERLGGIAIGRHLEPTFSAATLRLGDRARFAPPHIKPTLFQPLMQLSATSGFTDPWTHEINVDAGAFAFERPAYYAHEWAHLAGFTDEAEANFIAVLACTNSHDPLLVYAGWLLVWFNLPSNVHVTHRIDRLAYDDIAAIRARYLRQVNRSVARVQEVAYDKYLKSNRVKAGYDSYRLFIRWMTGADFDASGLPRVRAAAE